MDAAKMREFATRYTAAWCSQDAASVASFFAANGSLKINNGSPSVGRAAITSAAQGFRTDFPDMVVKMDELSVEGRHRECSVTNSMHRGRSSCGASNRLRDVCD